MSLLKQEKKFLFLLYVVSVALRLFVFSNVLRWGEHSWRGSDARDYSNFSQQIIKNGNYSSDEGIPTFWRLPGYPLFLALCNKLFNCNVEQSLLVQIVVTSIIPILIFFLVHVLFPTANVLAKIAAMCSLVHVGFVVDAGMISTEMLFLIFMVLFFIYFFSSFRIIPPLESSKISLSIKKIFLAGLFWGTTSLIRPVGHYVLIVSIIVLLASHELLMNKLKMIFALIIGWIIIVAPWLIRNYILTGAVFFHTLPGEHFVHFMAVPMYMEEHNVKEADAKKVIFDEWENEIKTRECIESRQLNEYERCVMGEKFAFNYIKRAPFIACTRACREMCKTIFALHTAYILYRYSAWLEYDKNTSILQKMMHYLMPHTDRPFIVFLIWFEIIYMFFLLTGSFLFIICSLLRKENLYVLAKTLPFVVLFVFITLAYGCARLRIPIEPFLIIFPSAFWLNFFKFVFRLIKKERIC